MVVKTAHRLLEEQAKDKAGRNAIAIAVWRRPGIVMEFARHWQPPSIVEDLEKLRADVLERNYSSSFLYRLQNLSEITKTLSDADEQALLVAEYMKSREREVTREEAEERVQLIQRLCRSDTDRVEPVLFGNFLATQEG
jgi:CRISPR-associated protein Cmr2